MYPDTTLTQRLLIVDDDPSNIRLLASIFDDAYDILFATSGKDALRIATNESPDLILLDVMMPEMDGYQVCRLLKADLLTQDIPIIFVTAHSDVEEEIHGLEIGAADFITKPFCPAIVKIRVRNQIELKSAREKLIRLAITDGLTGIPNRRYFDEQLAHEWHRAMRMNHELAVAMIDVDWFKKYNDYYGHQAGDDCLRRVAKTLAYTAKRCSDVVARYGGEEFSLILPTTNSQAALIVAQNACLALSNLQLPHALSDFGNVTLSVGVAVGLPTINETADKLVRHADEALYTAKHQGRNQAVLYQPKES
jgi:diguanylate cyclase (GGDEF)-like protein